MGDGSHPSHRDALGEALWNRLCERGTDRSFEGGEILINESRPGGRVFALRSGEVVVTRFASPDRELVLAWRGPGELLGELSVLGEADTSATVRATTACRLSLIPAATFRAFLEEDDVRERLHRHAVGRLRAGEDVRVDVTGFSAPRTVARALVRLSDTVGRPQCDRMVLHVTQDVLAAYVGTARNTVQAAVGRLRKAGIVETHPSGRIVVTDLPRLRRIAEGQEAF